MTSSPQRAAQSNWVGPHVVVLNGPNLGRLGKREPHIYGHTTHDELANQLKAQGQHLNLNVTVQQTDAEHIMLGWLHDAADNQSAVVINPGGWTHTSVALRDAAAQVTAPLVEVHISNVHAREEFRKHSYLSPVATGVISGLGLGGYAAALTWLASLRDSAAPGA